MKAGRGVRFKHVRTLCKKHEGAYGAGELVYVDIVIDKAEKTLDSWLYDGSHGIKESMFGVMLDETISEKDAVKCYCDLVDYWMDDYADDYLKARYEEDGWL